MDELIDDIIRKAIDSYDGSCGLEGPFEQLLSFGELVDRLSIVNFKLYTLKDKVMNSRSDSEFCSHASVEDVRLVEERARLKRCIDEKLICIIGRISNGDSLAGFNAEVKRYGN